MKNFSIRYLFLFPLLAIAASGCLKDECDAELMYLRYDPVFILPATLRQEIKMEPERDLKQPGKIYVYGSFLLVNEYGEGIHILNNQDPASPQHIGFLPIPGNIDMAVRNGVLYADSYVDLVVMDITDPANPKMINRLENVFPHMGFDGEKGFLVEYKPTEVKEQVPCNEANGSVFFDKGVFWVRTDVAFANAESKGAAPGNTVGIGGSTARFTIGGKTWDHLYTVSNYDLKVFDLKVAEKPNLAKTVSIGWGIETIYPYQDKLFIGGQNGMYIFDASNPLEPKQLGIFQHARACDPVVTDGNYAYVTLRDGTECQNFLNQLDVVDIADVTKPKLLKTYPMHHPIGLSIVNKLLFICDDEEGLKLFDASEWDKIDKRMLDHEKGINAFDVIALENERVAIVTGSEGIYQYDFSDPKNLKQLSFWQKKGK